MSYRSGSQMRGKAAALILLLVVILGCHAISAHCGRELDGGGDLVDGRTGRGGIKFRPLEGICIKRVCVADSLPPRRLFLLPLPDHGGCFCCQSMPESPCFRKEADCVKVCQPEALPPWSPPPPPAL